MSLPMGYNIKGCVILVKFFISHVYFISLQDYEVVLLEISQNVTTLFVITCNY
jgi:hypothetical protein